MNDTLNLKTKEGMAMNNKAIGEMIFNQRKEKNMTQLALANQLNMTDKAVSKWERGIACPSIDIIPKLAEILGVRTEELINGAAIDAAGNDALINDLSVYAQAVYLVELSRGKKINAAKRVPVKASVNPKDGEVKFYIDLKDIGKLL